MRTAARLLVLCSVAASVVSLVATVAPGGAEDAPAASAPQPICRPKLRTVLRRVGHVELSVRPFASTQADALFACLDGQRYAFATTNFPERPPYWPRSGPPMLQVAGPYLALVGYDSCGKDPYPCGGPFAYVADLRRNRSVARARRFVHTVKVRVNERGSVAVMVRDYPQFLDVRLFEEDFPPGPGPFRVDVYDRDGQHTADSGPGIEPLSLTMKGRRVSWTHDGQTRTTLVKDQAASVRG